jgi:hypothetical protein
MFWEEGGGGRLTYNEGATLIFLSMWKVVDGFYDLDARITVDVDAIVRCGARDTISNVADRQTVGRRCTFCE